MRDGVIGWSTASGCIEVAFRHRVFEGLWVLVQTLTFFRPRQKKKKEIIVHTLLYIKDEIEYNTTPEIYSPQYNLIKNTTHRNIPMKIRWALKPHCRPCPFFLSSSLPLLSGFFSFFDTIAAASSIYLSIYLSIFLMRLLEWMGG